MYNKERKVLYSPGYGAGWASWHGYKTEEKAFSSQYQPIIAYLEAGGDAEKLTEDHPIIQKFVAEYNERFGDEPYTGGAHKLKVATVHGPYRIEEYDGYESVLTDQSEGWM